MSNPTDVVDAIAAIRDADRRLHGAVEPARWHNADVVRTASRLPDWTVGHVLTHLARNADALRNVLQGAVNGELRRMYPSPEARQAAIDEGAERGADAIADDLADATARLEAAVAAVPDQVWQATVDLGRGGPTTADVLLWMRIAEVELHHHDLGVDDGLALLDQAQADRLLQALQRTYVRTRDVPGMTLQPDGGTEIELAGGGQRIAGPAVDLIGWLVGRSDGSTLSTDGDLPDLPPW